MIIYKITNKINGKSYIGQTINKLEIRLKNHFSLNRKASNSAIHLAIKKYGKEEFNVETICCAANLDNLNYLEEFFIEYYNTFSPNGYNLVKGGDNHKRSEETCKKISIGRKGIPNTKLKGVPKTEEHKQKLRLAHLGKKQTKEHALNSAKARVNKKLKIVVVTNKQVNVSFSVKGIKYLSDLGFDKSRVHRVINTDKVYKNCTFKHASLSETKLKGL